MNDQTVTFYLADLDTELLRWEALEPDSEPESLVRGEHCWIAQTYSRLKSTGLEVRLDNKVPASGVCIFYAAHKQEVWNQLRKENRTLLVAVRGDRNPVGFADYEIVQNMTQGASPRDVYVPHWPQPGLIPRAYGRENAIKNIVFVGAEENMHSDFMGSRWRRFLEERGLQFSCALAGGSDIAMRWHDYSEADIVVAVRPSGMKLVANKPSSKLINAWLAGVPAILGPESGYRELREDPLDYLEAGNLDAVMAALDRLLAEPATYRAMIVHGQRRGLAFTREATVQQWRNLIEQVLLPAATRLQRHPVRLWRRRWWELRAKLRRVVRGKA